MSPRSTELPGGTPSGSASRRRPCGPSLTSPDPGGHRAALCASPDCNGTKDELYAQRAAVREAVRQAELKALERVARQRRAAAKREHEARRAGLR